jgi:Tfp pilus assembly protein PilN
LGLPCRSAGAATFSAGGEKLSAEWAALIGAARQSLGLGGFPLLIEPQARVGQARNQERSRAVFATVAALAVAVLLGMWQFDRQQQSAADVELAGKVSTQIVQDRKLLGVLTKRRDLLREQWSTVGGAAGQGDASPLELLRRAASTAPPGVWLTEMTAETGEPLRLVGTSRDEASVSRWLRSLERAPGFASVELGFVRSGLVDATPVTQFRIDCTLEAPVAGGASDRLVRGLPRETK